MPWSVEPRFYRRMKRNMKGGLTVHGADTTRSEDKVGEAETSLFAAVTTYNWRHHASTELNTCQIHTTHDTVRLYLPGTPTHDTTQLSPTVSCLTV